MRIKRIKGGQNAVYNCTSKIINSELFLKGVEEKQKIKDLILAQTTFTGLVLNGFQIMDNKVHITLRETASVHVNDDELIRRVRILNGDEKADLLAEQLKLLIGQGEQDKADELRAPYFERMNDISIFMKEVKGKFTTWYNAKHNRTGPLWNDRFHSTVAEFGGSAPLAFVAYDDLNMVRAGLLQEPEMDIWSSLGSAMRGCPQSLMGITEILQCFGRPIADALAFYRQLLRTKTLVDLQGSPGLNDRIDISNRLSEPHEIPKSIHKSEDPLLSNWPNLTHSCVVGSLAFVQKIYHLYPEALGVKRVHVGRYFNAPLFPNLVGLRQKHKHDMGPIVPIVSPKLV